MKVPQLTPYIGNEEYKAVEDCFKNNWITEGPKAKEFVERLLKLSGAKYGVLAPNGTLALYLALKAVKINPGDEVIVPDFTFIGSATAIEMIGAIPVFVDVNQSNFQIDLKSAENRLSKKTKAIMPVHIYGTIAKMEEVIEFAKKHNLKVVEDAAEAVGVKRNGIHAGTFGDVGCFSFFADKTITTGEGGMIVTNDPEIYDNLLYLRNQGRINRGSFIHPRIGYNFRMTDLQCAVGLVQLDKLEEIKTKKENNLQLYKKYLTGVDELTYFQPDEGSEFLPFRVGILYEYAQELMDYLKEQGVEPRTFFYPLHKQPCFEELVKRYKYEESEFVNSVYGYEHGICLPVFASLSEEEIKFVCKSIKDFIYEKKKLFYTYYDLLYKDKNYKDEVNNIFNLLSDSNFKSANKALEIGSGTGNHTIHFSKRIKNVTAIDIDEEMIKIAKEKLNSNDIKNVKLLHTDIQELKDDEFDIVLAMFNVITYVEDLNNLERLIKNISQRLKTGGYFVFDCWNGLAAIKDPPVKRSASIKNGKSTLVEHLTPSVDYINQKVYLKYALEVTTGKTKKYGSYVLKQTLWTPMELSHILNKYGLEVVRTFSVNNYQNEFTAEDWKIGFVCKKINR